MGDDVGARRPAPDPAAGMTLEAIRARLKERGYLGGVAGWVASARAGGWVRYSAASSLRAGAVGGPLLAVPAAAAIALANRPHLDGAKDLVILGLYLAIVLGIVLAVLEFLTDVTLALVARSGLVLVGRAERLAGRAGLLFTAATTLYLAFLLRGSRAGSSPGLPGSSIEGPLAWLAWGALLVAALGIGHLVGRLTRVGSLVAAVLASGASGASGTWGQSAVRPTAKRRAIALGAGLALLVTAGLVVFSSGPRGATTVVSVSGARALAPLPARPTPGRIMVLGVDGMGEDLFEEASADASRHPALARLRSEGARYPIVREAGRIPPSVWTSIATGRPADEHGVLAFSAERIWGLSTPVQPAGERGDAFALSPRLLWPPMHPRPGPVDATLRRAPALWEILEAAGVPSASINWWASWPAVEGGGIIVSDRALLRLLAGAALDRDVWPPPLQRNLEARFPEMRRGIAALVGDIEGSDDAQAMARRAATGDAYHAQVARQILDQDEPPRVVLLYLPGLDIVRAGPDTEEGVGAGTGWLLSHLDALAGEIMGSAGPDDLLLIVGDPGRRVQKFGSIHSRQAEGVFLAWGAAAHTGGRVVPGFGPRQSYFDLAPTVLALSGLPLARELPGRPILGFLRPGDPAAQEGEAVASYGELSADPGQEDDPMDDEVLDRLRSLGYIR